jgi:hypothetical protein
LRGVYWIFIGQYRMSKDKPRGDFGGCAPLGLNLYDCGRSAWSG